MSKVEKCGDEFWLRKRGVTLDYSFYRTDYQDVEPLIVELDAFWDFLLADKQISNVATLPSSVNATEETNRKKRTAAKHCMVVCNFIKFLSSTYVTASYIDEDRNTLRRLRTKTEERLNEAREKFIKFSKSAARVTANFDDLKSLTPIVRPYMSIKGEMAMIPTSFAVTISTIWILLML